MLNIILGRAGSGKTEFVFNSIKEEIKQGNSNILLITPEQYSFISERRLLKDLGESDVGKVENASFSRLSNEISREYGEFDLPILSKGSKAVVFKKACQLCKDDLKLFGKNTNNNAFINSAIKIYDEMKSCRVSVQDIISASENSNKELLSQKLYDISVIMNTYDNLIKDKYIDCANELTFLYEKLENIDYFKDKTVYIDGFNGFVAQEYKIIEVILKQAKNVYITFCSDSSENTDKYDLFYYINRNIAILKDVAEKVKCQYKVLPILESSRRYNNEELKYIERYLYSSIKEKLDTSSNVKIYASKSLIDECNFVASNISKLLRQGIKASDIAVTCRDLNKYKRELQFAFKKYNIPYFNDERQNISSTPLIMFVNFLLRVATFSFSSDDIFSLLKTGLTSLTNDEINELENYTFLWNISGSKWKKEFSLSTKGFAESIDDKDQKRLDDINKSRKYVVDNLTKFINSSKNKTPKEISQGIYFTLIDMSVDKGVTSLAKDLENDGKSALAKEQGRVWDLLMDILDKLATVGGDEIISIKEYSKLFNLMIMNEDLGAIPAGLDNVQLGSADRMRFDNPYAVFVVGANEGVFPQNITSSGLLTESDRVTLIDNDFKLYSYGEVLSAQERFFAYSALSSARDKIFISYDNSVDSSDVSEIVNLVKEILPNVIIENPTTDFSISNLETNDNAFEILASNYNRYDSSFISTLKEYFSSLDEYKDRIDAIEKFSKNEDVSITDKDLATNLFKKDMYLSASKIEKYFDCAFMYFCKYGLNVKPRKKAEIDSLQKGSIIHYILECIIREVGSKGLCTLDIRKAVELVNKYLLYYFNNKMGDSGEFTKRFKYLFFRLSNTLVYILLRLKEEFKTSDFEAKGFEVSIGDGSRNEEVVSKKIPLSDGGTIQINGSIDRVDTYEENDVQYVRVVDYKSGTKTFRLNDVINGLNLQMFVYLSVLCDSNSKLSGTKAGVLYMPADRDVYNVERANMQTSIQKNDNSKYKMMGVILNDDEHSIAKHMEYDLNEKFIPAKEDKFGVVVGDIASLEDFGRISRKVNELIVEMGENLHNGNINQNPVLDKNHDKTCEWCDYKDVCLSRLEVKNRELEDLSFGDVLEKLKGEQDND